MISIIATDATPSAPRFRVSAHCPDLAGGTKLGRRIADVDVFGYGTGAPAANKDASSGVGAWSPPV